MDKSTATIIHPRTVKETRQNTLWITRKRKETFSSATQITQEIITTH